MTEPVAAISVHCCVGIVRICIIEECEIVEYYDMPLEMKAVAMINPAILREVSGLRDKFSKARPFPHIVIDDFFEAEKAERLLDDFPPFDPLNAKNEFGK